MSKNATVIFKWIARERRFQDDHQSLARGDAMIFAPTVPLTSADALTFNRLADKNSVA